MSDPPREDDLPWERPGAVRRDCEPHRGELLKGLALLSLLVCFLAWVLVPLAAAGLPLAVMVRVLAGRDLARMRSGRMDPAGRKPTEEARGYALAGAVLGLADCLLWAGFLLWVARARPR